MKAICYASEVAKAMQVAQQLCISASDFTSMKQILNIWIIVVCEQNSVKLISGT